MKARAIATTALAVAAALPIGAPPASALVLPPTTIDGPSPAVLEFGGVAMAPDGTGGLVYTKSVGGVAHVFASRFDGLSWSAPMRVDGDQPFEAREPRIAAGEDGRLLVVWVTPVGTAEEKVQRALASATLGPGADEFGPMLLVDPDIGEGAGATPALAGTDPGKAIVVYRVVTEDFSSPTPHPQVRLRPGDVMMDVRVARLESGRWSRLGPVNLNPAASMRPPSAANAPQVAIAADGGAAVAWQEPDSSGTARVLLRRVFGTTLGPVLEVSPTSWNGRPIAGDADAISLDVTPLGQVRVAMRVGGGPGSALSGPRLFLNTLPPGFLPTAGTPTGAEIADGGGAAPLPGGVGAPSVAASDEGGGEGSLRLAFAASGQPHEMGVDDNGKLVPIQLPAAPGVLPGGDVVAAVNPAGGGTAAWPARDRAAGQALAVRQELASGAAQTGIVSGVRSGPVSSLSIGRSGAGDALIGFRQGEPGGFEIVALRTAAAPVKLALQGPPGWVRPPRAKLHWEAPRSAVGGLSYSVLVDGRVVRSGLHRRRFRPRPAVLGSGTLRTQVLATDRLGEQLLSRPTKLRVDARPPRVRLRVRSARGAVLVRISDAQSGLRKGATRVGFGDGARARGGSELRHRYRRGGTYPVLVRARDRAGNAIAERFEVRAR